MSLRSRGKSDGVMVSPWRAFAGAGCYGYAGMGGKPAKPSPSVIPQRLLLPVILFALAACATPGGPGASEQDKPLYPGPQSNVASLSEVIAAHPDGPAGLQYARLGL